ncbi:GNAT family N-acetyltransferase [Siphonobacter sp. BAB-5405]|uniref:GNAT family N-acetyltransferase n=1 Tax=Siphonobacter sp. BAB-5405 TaxID=1864825 RepID=UPI000C7FA637|nr:GNAT family N-acetyltransferase [Siphonobacter sp. BAB-5405]PMD98286.1 GNAT family N-acetyltransferase [Siphonobacter sp. BAB-5405]
MIDVRVEPIQSADAQFLLAEAVQELQRRYPDFPANEYHSAEAPGSAFVIARIEGKAVGCGALRPYAPEVVEIKRMFVLESYRRQGVSRRLLETLEAEARRLSYRRIILETGVRQPEAIELYRRTGYEQIPNYGYDGEDSLSVCFGKDL